MKAGPKHLVRTLVDGLTLSAVACERDLVLVSLRGHGLRRLGASQGTLVEPGPDAYPATAPWGVAAHAWPGRVDGLIWVSRQFPGGLALLLFGDRVGKALRPDGDTLPLASGRGFELLCEAANKADVVLVGA